MGEATPAGAFAPMLGVAVGSVPGGVGASRGSAVPQLHSAIVERLRARIELCRRHHSSCETRYQRGQAETTDREHESTLHLLNIVQQGPGTRKGKASRGSNHQPPEYSRANGEQRGPDGDQKVSMRMALHGSLRRKIEGQAPKPGAASCPFPGSDFKRARMDSAGPGPGHPSLNASHSFQGSTQRKPFMMSHGVGSDIFNMTLKEMKKEPAEVQSCGQSSADMIFDFKDEGQLDPELQDLFDELTKSASPLNDLEFEKMLKQDDAFGLDLGRPSSVGAAAALGSPLDKPIKLEHSPDFGHVQCGSPQLRPASAGPAFALAGASSGSTSQKANAQSGPPRSMPCWPEISHAEQLKQMAAANQQQPSALLHHQAPGLSGWSPAISSSSGSFPQDGLPGPAPLARVNAPGINNCLFKSNGHSGAHRLDVKVLGSKPTLHFSPKSSHATGQPLMPDPLSKSATQQQHSPSSSQHSALHFQNQQMSASASLCLQSKPSPLHAGGLPFKLAQPRQNESRGGGTHGDDGPEPRPRALGPGARPGGSARELGPGGSGPGARARGLGPGARARGLGPGGSARGLGPGAQSCDSLCSAEQAQSAPLTARLPRLSPNISINPEPQSQDGGPPVCVWRHCKRPAEALCLHLVVKARNCSARSPGLHEGSPSGPRQPVNGSLAPPALRAPAPTGQLKGPVKRQLTPATHSLSPDKDGPLDQFSRHLTRPPPEYKHSRSVAGLQQQGGVFPGPSSSGPDKDPHKMNPSPADRRFGTDCPPQFQQHSGQRQLGLGQNKPRFLSTNAPGSPFGLQHSRAAGDPGPSLGGLMTNVSWGSANKQAGLGSRRPPGPLQTPGPPADMYQQRHIGPPNQVAPDPRMLPLNPGQPVLSRSSPEQRVPAGGFADPGSGSSSYPSSRAGRVTFDFLPEGDNSVPGINTDSDFIDSLLKSGSGNDDWMKDINLDEILGSSSII
ncbi:mastermind-like protein 2 [Neosynchiropus ocellatus]